jgi:signal peptidase I
MGTDTEFSRAMASWFQQLKTVLSGQTNDDAQSGGEVIAPPPPVAWEALAHPQLEFNAPPDPLPVSRAIKQIWMALLVIFFSTTVYYFVSRYVVTAVIVDGASMQPTLHDGDRLLLNRWAYRYRKPARGDLVVIKDPGHSDFAVKRIVGLPLESVQIKRGEVYLNGRVFSEPYLQDKTLTFTPDAKEKWDIIGKDRYFVLGDNRAISEDSRYYGTIRRDQIIGVIRN